MGAARVRPGCQHHTQSCGKCHRRDSVPRLERRAAWRKPRRHPRLIMAASMVSSSSSPSTASSAASPQSLLYPPNPSLSPTQPPGSILLNRNEVPRLATPPGGEKGLSASKALQSIRSSFSWKEDSGPRPPAALINTRARHSSISSTSSASIQSSDPGSPKPTSPQIRFAPLPTPPNLQRTRSITLGVAARSSLLRTQGSAAQGMGMGGPAPGGSRSGGGKIQMTDAEWAEYTQRYQE